MSNYIPWQVGKRVEYLLGNGRRVEVLALLAIEWEQFELQARYELWSESEKLRKAFEAAAAVIGATLMPVFERMIAAFSETARALADFTKAAKDGANV